MHGATIKILEVKLFYFQNLRFETCWNLRERDHWGDPGADGRIILRWIFRKWEGL